MRITVNIELAKRLKAMGYPQQEDNYFCCDGETGGLDATTETFFAPSFLDVIEWLYKVHNVLLWVTPLIVSNTEIEWYANVYPLDLYPLSVGTTNMYDTYTKGISLALDKIEENKPKS